MNETLKNALEITPTSLSEIQSDITARINDTVDYWEKEKLKKQEYYNRRLASVREREIVIVEELILLEPTFSYSLFNVTEPSQQELESIANKLDAMCEKDRTDTITKLNEIVKQLMYKYKLNNNSTNGIKDFLRTQLNTYGII